MGVGGSTETQQGEESIDASMHDTLLRVSWPKQRKEGIRAGGRLHVVSEPRVYRRHPLGEGGWM